MKINLNKIVIALTACIALAGCQRQLATTQKARVDTQGKVDLVTTLNTPAPGKCEIYRHYVQSGMSSDLFIVCMNANSSSVSVSIIDDK